MNTDNSRSTGRRAAFASLAGLLSAIAMGMAGCSDDSESSKNLASELESALSDLGDKIDMLNDSVESFGDGSTNWRDIVPDVESEFDDVKSAFDDVQSSFLSLQDALNKDSSKTIGRGSTGVGN